MSGIAPLEVWTDGSGTHDASGPACIGVVLFLEGEALVEVSEHVGPGTNNVAELRAIRRGLHLAELLVGREREIIVYSDSEYSIGILGGRWDPRANRSLVLQTREQLVRLPLARFVHVPGHEGIFGNELADWLAGEARRRLLRSQGLKRPNKRRPTPERCGKRDLKPTVQ